MTISRSVAVSVAGGINAMAGELGRLVNVPLEFSLFFDFQEDYYIVRENYYLEESMYFDFNGEYFYVRDVGFYPQTNVRV